MIKEEEGASNEPHVAGIGECVGKIIPRETFYSKWKESKLPDYQKPKALKIGEKINKYKEYKSTHQNKLPVI